MAAPFPLQTSQVLRGSSIHGREFGNPGWTALQLPCVSEQPCLQGNGVTACLAAWVLLLLLQLLLEVHNLAGWPAGVTEQLWHVSQRYRRFA
jgi:hypothetical protein